CAALFLAASGYTGAALERAGQCLALHQDPRSGGVATYRAPGPIRRYMRAGRGVDMSGWCSFHLEVTATAGRAFAVSGHDTQASRAWRYVRERQDADGAWSGYWWTARQYPTLQAGALAHLLGEPGPVKRAAQWVIREQ